jgi:hypothetical protein
VSLRPHEFRALREFLDSIERRLNSLEETISRCGEAIFGVRDEIKTEREIKAEISRQIPSLSVPMEQRKIDGANQERRHIENQRVQRWIMRGTWFTGICTLFAFGAAAYYANEARKQSITLGNTYGEIRMQTKAAQDTAKAAQDQATLMRRQAEGTMAAMVSIGGLQVAGNPCCKVTLNLDNVGHDIAEKVSVSGRSAIYNAATRQIVEGPYPIYMSPRALRPDDQSGAGGQIPIPVNIKGFNQEMLNSISRFEKYIRFDILLSYDDGFGTVSTLSKCYIYTVTSYTQGNASNRIPPYPNT